MQQTKLWFNHPARNWNEALPIGNGRLGAMVFGGFPNDRIQINEETVWAGMSRGRVNPAGPEALPRVRDLLFAGKNAEAQELAASSLLRSSMRLGSYQPLCDLLISVVNSNGQAKGLWDQGASNMKAYRRELDLADAVHRASFEHSGEMWSQNCFVSAAANLLCLRIETDHPERMHLTLRLDRGQDALSNRAEANRLLMCGRIGGDGVQFAAMLEASVDSGEIVPEGNALRIRGAGRLEIRLAGATSYNSPTDLSGDPVARCEGFLSGASETTFDELLREHQETHRAFFDRVTIVLPEGPTAGLPTDARVRAAAEGMVDPSLAALYFQFGRYLLLSSSRPGTFPANLQGIWNEQG